MKLLWGEVKKIMRQLRGSENIFGYKSTIANQIFLFYCLCGKIYFTDRVNSKITRLWYILISSELAISFVLTLVYFLYDHERKLISILNILNAVGTCFVSTFGFPLISKICDHDIEAIIEHVDKMLSYDNGDSPSVVIDRQKRLENYLENVFRSLLGFLGGCILVYLFISFFDVLLFFDEEKVKSDYYYMSPIPLMREHGTITTFLLLNGISTFVFAMFLIKLTSVFVLVLYWSAVCCNELICLRDEFGARSRRLEEYIGEESRLGNAFENWSKAFNGDLQRGIVKFQQIIVLMNRLRTFVEVIGSFIAPVDFLYGIAVLYVCLSEDLALGLKLKFVAGSLGSTFSTFIFYWAGQKLDDAIHEVSVAVYSTPWYWSVKVRKNVYMLLCHCHTVKSFSILKIYGLQLQNFSRYCNGVMTYANLLRKLTSK